MKPCAWPTCPALATRGDLCPVHDSQPLQAAGVQSSALVRLEVDVEPVSAEETARAVATRDRIASLYARK